MGIVRLKQESRISGSLLTQTKIVRKPVCSAKRVNMPQLNMLTLKA